MASKAEPATSLSYAKRSDRVQDIDDLARAQRGLFAFLNQILLRNVVRSSRHGLVQLAAVALAAFLVTGFDRVSDDFIESHAAHSLWQTYKLFSSVLEATLLTIVLYGLLNAGVQTILRSFEMLHVVFAASSDGIFIADAVTGEIIDANEAGCAMLGYGRGEIVGLTIGALSSGVGQYTNDEGLKKMIPGLRQLFEWQCKTRDGSVFWAEVSARVAPMLNRMVCVAVVRDISQRKENEHKLDESRRMLEALFDNVDSGIIDADLSRLFRWVQRLKHQGVTDLRAHVLADERRLARLPELVRINTFNRAADDLFGLPKAVEDEHFQRLAGKADAMLVLPVAEAIFRGESSLRAEGELYTISGLPIPVLQSLPIPRTEADAKRVPCVIVDLRKLKMAEVARQANAAKSEFLATMSHEIRTPLNGVIGNLELLNLTGPTAEQFELIEQADKAAKALLALIGNILDFSKIEQGKLAIEMGEMNPAAVLDEAVSVLQSRARRKDIAITAIVNADVPDIVHSDAARIRQILLNLLGNAVKFTQTGGIGVRLSVTDWDGSLCELRFEVHDSGIGFDQAKAEALFEPFVQERDSTAMSEGTGLGLSICRKLLEILGGSISAEGAAGQGATFSFTLPVKVLKPTTAPQPADLRGTRIAIIHDGTPAGLPFTRYLSARGAAAVQVDHLPAARAALRENSGSAGGRNAILFAPGSEIPAEVLKSLQRHHVVPLMYGSDGSASAYRQGLRGGFAAVISTEEGPSFLDRNIAALLGRAPAACRGAPRAHKLDPSHRSKQVLVLEDRLVNQLVIQKQLTKLGAAWTIASDGLEGLAVMESRDFDLILCDCSMPRMDGYEFTRAVRKREKADAEARRVPIVALTANAFREDVEKCRAAGMDDFISKPVSMDRLVEVLNKWFGTSASAPGVDQAAPQDQAIDCSVLTSALGEMAEETLNEVLMEFSGSVRKSFAIVETALARGRVNGVQVAAHGAKGEARSAGANQLGELYAELERQAKAGEIPDAAGTSARIAKEIARVERFIADRLTARRAA